MVRHAVFALALLALAQLYRFHIDPRESRGLAPLSVEGKRCLYPIPSRSCR